MIGGGILLGVALPLWLLGKFLLLGVPPPKWLWWNNKVPNSIRLLVLTCLAYAIFLGHRSDYLGHYLAGIGGTLLLLSVPLALWKRPLGWIVPALLVFAIGLGSVAEATIFRIAIFDRVDFFNQSLGACVAGSCLVGHRRSFWSGLGAVGAGLILLYLGFYFAFA